ncbi:MAG TPA: TVP38/TMEM64 family protein [Candidatus Babeliales bacterium]|nr:TVP38/TMEM64 family protein [Candidatus Babeliales bacterium]
MIISKQKKITLLLLLLLMSFSVYFAQHSSYLSFACFNEVKEELLLHVQNSQTKASIIYILLYIVVTVLTPSAAMFALAGGFLFGVLKATAFIIIGATVSGSLAFFATRYLLGEQVQRSYSAQLKKFNDELKQYGSYYFLMVRIIPIFPFFLINIIAGLTTISFSTFAWTTALGIIPGTMIYTYAGRQLCTINSPRDILSPHLFAALFCLGLLALVPVLLKKRKNLR